MMRRDTALTIGGMMLGAALLAKAVRSRRGMDLSGRVALITGGSRGLGLLIARELGRQGCTVILAARDEIELQRAQQELSAQQVEVFIQVADVTRQQDAERIVTDAVAQHGRLDLLINNAGIITVGPFAHMGVSDFDEAMATHFWGPLHTMRAAIPHMQRAGGGRIANVSSIGGRIGVPHLVPYCASKFALTGLSTSVRSELAVDNILVTTVCPGLMRTGSPFNAWFKGRHREEFAWFAIADSLPLLSIDGARAAAQIVDAVRHGDAELVVSWPARLAIAATAIAPDTMGRAMGLVGRLLPAPTGARGDRGHSGWQSASKWAPSVLTRTSERAAGRNNELPGGD